MGWRLRLLDKTVQKFAELPIYCQGQKCSPGNVVSGGIRFMQMYAGVRWAGSVKWECGRWKWRFSLLSFTVFSNILHTWPPRSFHVMRLSMTLAILDCFTSNFSRTVRDTAKVTIDWIINHTLAFDWCHFWWPCMIFEGHFIPTSNISEIV